jgi:hypothetical protein
MISRDKLMNDPSSVFEKPSDVIDNMELSAEQKIEVLQQWKQDIMLRIVAEEENMAGTPENSERLKQVTDALIALGED